MPWTLKSHIGPVNIQKIKFGDQKKGREHQIRLANPTKLKNVNHIIFNSQVKTTKDQERHKKKKGVTWSGHVSGQSRMVQPWIA